MFKLLGDSPDNAGDFDTCRLWPLALRMDAADGSRRGVIERPAPSREAVLVMTVGQVG